LLAAHLSSIKTPRVMMSFREIEAVLGFGLPRSSRAHRAWWGNHHGNPQASGWLDAGMKVAKLALAEEQVEFVRTGSAELAASKSDNFTGEQASPMGAPAPSTPQRAMTPAGFEALSREVMGAHYGKKLSPIRGPFPKTFDLVSSDLTVVGDAKYFTMVGGSRIPPAKFSVIAEHVWLLEKTGAPQTFVVFGNDRRVPEEWLKRYGHLVKFVRFFFLNHKGSLEVLK